MGGVQDKSGGSWGNPVAKGSNICWDIESVTQKLRTRTSLEGSELN